MKSQITFLLLCLVFASKAQELSFSTFDEKHGITQPYIYNITQNKNGFLCFTTSEGAYKFDGINISRIDKPGSIKEPFFKSLLLVGDNTTYLGSNTGGVFKIKNGKVVWRHVKDKYTAPVNYLKQWKGKVYAFYQDGTILEISGDGKTSYHFLEKGYLYSSFSFFNGKFVAGRDIGFLIFGFQNGKIKVEKEVSVKDDAVESICVYKNTLFLGTGSNGLFTYSSKKLQKIDLGTEELNQSNIKAIFKDDLSSVWISVYGVGVYEVKRNSQSGAYYVRNELSEEKGIPSPYVTSLFIDRESNLWMGSLGKGISKLNSNSLVHFDLKEYNLGNSVYSVYCGNVSLFGLKGGIVQVDTRTDEVTPWPLNSQLPNDNITSIRYVYATKTYYIGTQKSGLFSYVSGSNRIVPIELSMDLLSKTINHINPVGSVIFVSTMNGLYRYDTESGRIDHYSTKDGMPNNVIHSTFLTTDGRLILGTLSKGLFFLRGETVREMKVNNPYGLIEISGFAEDRRGDLWLSTNGQGLFHLSSGNLVRISATSGLFSDFVYQLTIDMKNTIWCGHRGGMSRVNQQHRVLDKYDYRDDISMDFYLNASGADSENNLWFGTSDGILKFSILQDKFNIYKAKPVLISAMVNDAVVANAHNLVLNYQNSNKVKFTFQTVSLAFPEDVLYQYRLLGSDGRWSAASKENTASLGQLFDGEFDLEVRSKMGNGDWSKPTIIAHISVRPPFWKKWWFFAFVILGVVGFTMLISSYRTRNLTNQKAILEEKLAIRTKEIENKNAKITQQFEEMQESIDYGVRIQNSLLPNSRSLTNLIPDSFLFFQPKDKVSGDFYYFEKFGNQVIVSVADATGHGVPGAFISLIGFVSLKEIIHRSSISEPGTALTELDHEINTTLGQYNRPTDGKDGMDMAVCSIDLDSLEVVMASALRPIWLFRDGRFEKVRSSKFSIGGGMEPNSPSRKEFDVEKRQLKKGDSIYLFTDGYVDQFGSERDKKLMSKRFLALIQENYHLSMPEQGRVISKFLNDWKGNRDQTDDILVIGLRL